MDMNGLIAYSSSEGSLTDYQPRMQGKNVFVVDISQDTNDYMALKSYWG